MRTNILVLILLITITSNSQNYKSDLNELLIEKEILDRKIKEARMNLIKNQPDNEKGDLDIIYFEELVNQEAIWLEKFLSQDYMETYKNLMIKIKNSPNTKRLENTIINQLNKMKDELRNEIEKIPSKVN